MTPDYNFYKDVYLGTLLSENDFNKYISKGLAIISSYTMDRVRESTIGSFPESLSINIQKCACELSEFLFDKDNINNSVTIGLNNGNTNNQTISNISSMKAGEVTITYNSNTINKVTDGYIDYKEIKKRYSSILNSYLYPQYINGQYYNVLSWVG